MKHRPSFIFWILMASLLLAQYVYAEVPFPKAPSGVDVYAYQQYCKLKDESGNILPFPANYNRNKGEYWKYTSDRSGNSSIDNKAQELYGVMGMSVDKAWEITTGRPDVIIAIIDSGIKWDDKGTLVIKNKFSLNRGELPLPQGSMAYDANYDGVFNMLDYINDTRVSDWNGNGFKDPQDLIKAFWNGGDDDGNGYVDDICGWDMVDDDNDPFDDVHYGHGTGEAEDSCAEAYIDSTAGFPGTCPNCMILPIRVGLSFVASDVDFGRSVIFAVDSGASVIQEALGTINGSALSQAAINYAYSRDVPIIASAADEESFHQNLPAAHEHMITFNSVTKYEEDMYPQSYLFLNGCTNYGGNIAASVSSSSCSSEAVGRGAGITGLILSAAKNRGIRLTANEIKQIITMSTDDIDFSGNYWCYIPLTPTKRFESGPGWDQYFGYGRMNAHKAVKMVEDDKIPPEADIVSPAWFATIDPVKTQKLDIIGSVAANRAESYTYWFEYAQGIDPWKKGWQKIPNSMRSARAPQSGMLYAWDIGAFLNDEAPVGPNDFTYCIRMVVNDNRGNRAEALKTIYIHHDRDLKSGFPKVIGSSGEASVSMADLDGDNIDEMIIPTTDGIIHALNADGSEVPGWPVTTDLLAYRYVGSKAFTTSAMSSIIYEAIGYGGVAVGDLDRDGDLEVVAASLNGKVYVWEHDGRMRNGFPVSLNPAYSLNPRFNSKGSERDFHNRRLFGVVSSPVLEDMDLDGRLEILCAALDSHVYVWKDGGDLMPGWPVLAIDHSRFDVLDLITDKIIPKDTEICEYYLGEIVSTPAVGDINSDGYPEIIVGTNEQYNEPMNIAPTEGLLGFIALLNLLGGNARLHAFHHDGNEHSGGPFVEGWPVSIALLMPEQLPYIGSGHPGSPVLADVNHDRRLEIASFAAQGPIYLLRGDGSSYYNRPGDKGPYRVMDTGFLGQDGKDMPTVPAIGSAIFADINQDGRIECVAPSAGLKQVAELQYVEDQIGNENHITAWDAQTGRILPNFPLYMDDFQFITSPAVCDLDADGRPEIIEGSGGFLLRAYNAWSVNQKDQPEGWPKFTGKWILSSPAVGDIDGDGLMEIAVMTRSGDLYVWETKGRACEACNRQWNTFHHDSWHTGRSGRDATPPARPLDFKAAVEGGKLTLSFSGVGNDGQCGMAKGYEIRGANGNSPEWNTAAPVQTIGPLSGSKAVFEIDDPGFAAYGIQAKDNAGNVSMVVWKKPGSGTAGPEEFRAPSDSDGKHWYQCFIATAALQ